MVPDAPDPGQYQTRRDKITHRVRLVRAGASRRYYQYMPNKKHHRIAIWVAFFGITGTIIAQMLYPIDVTPPFASINGKQTGLQTRLDVTKQLTEKFRATKISLDAGGKHPVTYDLVKAGADQNTDRLAFEMTDYPFWQRFIPLSILWQTPHVETTKPVFSQTLLKTFSEARAKELSYLPEDARLTIKDGTLEAYTDSQGITVTPEDIERELQKATLQLGTTNLIKIPSKKTPPKTTAADFSEVKQQAEEALDRLPVVVAGDHTFTATKKDVASWLVIGLTGDKPALSVDKKAVKAYITKLNQTAGTKAGQTKVTIVNGIETERRVGRSGRALATKKLTEELASYVLSGEGVSPFQAEFVPVAPQIIYNNRYTASEAGLRAYVRDESRYGTHIVVKQIGGKGWTASARANESIASASTYKLYVSLWLFDQMDKGKIHWDDPWLDTTVSGCFDRMTIASTNPCAVAWLEDYGRSKMNSFVYDQGFSRGTTFTHPEAVHTTAADLAKFMVGLENGTLIGGAHRDRLLHSLSVHPYRYGIPTGSAGRVEDKVGFLWDYVHDSAIVHHPKGTYVLVIMTKGRSYAAIAAITKEIERIMYP